MQGYNTEYKLQIHKILTAADLILAIQIIDILHGSGERKGMGKIKNLNIMKNSESKDKKTELAL